MNPAFNWKTVRQVLNTMKVSHIIWALTAFALMASQMMPVSEACQQLIYLSSRPDNTRRNQTEWKPPTAEKSNHVTNKDYGGIPMLLIDYQRQNDYFFFNRDFPHENEILDKTGGYHRKARFLGFSNMPSGLV